MVDLSGLENLNTINLENLSIDRNLSISSNPMLTSLTGLENLDYTTIPYLILTDNNMLSACGSQLICDYLSNGGFANISNNASGCNTIGGVLNSCGFLPVEMESPLQVRLQNHTALLTWRTATETNNSGFEIHRSQDGINWQRIGWQVGQGTTTSPHTYTQADENPLTGTSYYRLKQVDFDGQFSYSNVVSLNYSRPQIDVFPNPVSDKLYIHMNGYIVDNVLIFNTMGQQINIPFDNNSIDVSSLSAGLYTLKIGMGEQYFYEKIVVE